MIYFLYIFFNIFISIIIFFIYKCSLKKKKNIYSKELKNISDLYKSRELSIIEYSSYLIIYTIFYTIDFILNLLRICFRKKHSKLNLINYNDLVDIYVIVCTILSCIFFFIGKTIQIFVCNYFIWRILLIIINKLQHVLNLKGKKLPISSYSRMIILTSLNFIDLLFCFSFLYFHFGVFPNNNIDLIINTLKLFVFIELSELFSYPCIIQKILIFSQIFTTIIFLLIFLANIANLNYNNKKNK